MQPEILDALRRGAHDDALTLAREAAAVAPRDAQAQRALAMALRAKGEHGEALAAIDRAIALAPDDADLHFHRAGFLLGARQIEQAQAALARSVGLDPNQFGAYVLQAQLALGRGDLDEAERLSRLAARIAPEHPWLAAIDGTLLLRRGDADGALAVLARAAEQAPDDNQVRYALGFAYLAKGHLAFAEQAFRGVLQATPDAHLLRALIAQLVQRQGRPADAADELAPLLADAATATPGLRRFAGQLELLAGRHERALPPLRESLAAEPRDPRTIAALLEAWRRSGDLDDARETLDAALAMAPEANDLWHARLSLEPVAGDAAEALIARWQQTLPDHVPALEAELALHGLRGDHDRIEAAAQRIVALNPGHGAAELRLVDAKLQRDPVEAIAYVESLIARAQGEDNRRLLRSWLALAHDRAGHVTEAARLWIALQSEVAEQRLPLPDTSAPRSDWPPLASADAQAAAVAFLVGPPGSGVERLATVLQGGVPAFRGDRLGARPPNDPLQNFYTVRRLAAGELDPAAVAEGWRAALPGRGIHDGQIIDWLLWWDNALLLALRPHLPEASLVIAVRDPRDMLLDWLAFGAPAPLRFAAPKAAAAWLAIVLNQIALLHEQDLFPHALIRLDDIASDPQALTQALAEALSAPLPTPPAGVLGPARFAPGRWRAYAEPLAEAFALLTPVAKRLGYAEA